MDLKHPDLLVLLKVAAYPAQRWTHAALGEALSLSASEAHAGVKRAVTAGDGADDTAPAGCRCAPMTPSCLLLRSSAQALGDLHEQVAFVGGAVAGLLVTDLLANAVRATRDVDAAVNASRTAFHRKWRLLLVGVPTKHLVNRAPGASHPCLHG
jgi:hypothetical protein